MEETRVQAELRENASERVGFVRRLIEGDWQYSMVVDGQEYPVSFSRLGANRGSSVLAEARGLNGAGRGYDHVKAVRAFMAEIARPPNFTEAAEDYDTALYIKRNEALRKGGN